MGHLPRFTATLRKLNVRKPNVRHPTHLYIARIDKRNLVPDDPIRMPDLPNVLVTNKVNINGIKSTALLDTRTKHEFINTAFKNKNNIPTIQTSERYVKMANGQRQYHRDTFTFVKNTGYSSHRGKTTSSNTYLGDRRQSVPTLHLFPCHPKLSRVRFTNIQLHASRHTGIISTCPTRDAFGTHLTPPPRS
jgi:hypothetical protein